VSTARNVQAASAQIVVGMHEFDRLIAKVNAAADGEIYALLDAIGQQQEDSARRRIRETKRGPDGERWERWSPEYAETREARHSLLVGEGLLADSMDHQVDTADKSVAVGSNMIYAKRHLFGDFGFSGPVRGGRIPARPYLDTEPGFADPHDRDELRDIMRAFLGGRL
jgi:phage gpG-like protein